MISLQVLQNCFYLVFGLAVTFYAILDGFDLGTGMLHLFNKKDYDRRIFLNAIGPVWDGNSVWLVIVLGTLFAGFPPVFAALFSGFYFLTLFLILGLMLRAVAIEFRSKRESINWRSFWDHVFCYASYVIAFGVGAALGNMIEGVPINQDGEFAASITFSLRPYAVLVGFLSMALFAMHGAIYLCMKTEGELHEKLRRWVTKLVVIFALIYVAVTIATILLMPYMADRIYNAPLLFVFPVGAFGFLYAVIKLFEKGKDLLAFMSSCAAIGFMFITYGLGTFPVLVRSTINPSFSLTAYNSSSSRLTLSVLLIIVITGVPLALAYGSVLYRIFKGKVKLNESSY